jgi:predicted nucleotidyltransferase
MRIDEHRASRREDILRIAASHGARNVSVFGSVARGDAGATSDVDCLVDLEPGRALFDLSGPLLDQEGLLHVSVDVVTEPGFRDRVRGRVLREAVPL